MCPFMYMLQNGSWASYQIRKIAGCACAGNAGNVFPRRRFQRKPIVSDRGMHHGTCVTHVPWCMSGSLTCGDGENVPGIPGACAPVILRIWQEAHGGIWDLCNRCIHGPLTLPILVGPWYMKSTHCGRDKMAAISQRTVSNVFSWMEV